MGYRKFPSPLGFVYFSDMSDAARLAFWGPAVCIPVVHWIGALNTFATLFLGGLAANFAFLFQAEINPKRLGTQFDCNASGRGALTALSTVACLNMTLRIAGTLRLPSYMVAFPMII